MIASQKGNLEIVQWILEHDGNPNSIDNKQRNAIFYAFILNADNSDVVRALLEKNAKVDQEDVEGNTPLIKACELGLISSVKVLLEFHADPNKIKITTGDTPLHFAARSASLNSAKIAEILIGAGAKISVPNKNQKTPLEEAESLKNKDEFIEILKKFLGFQAEKVDKMANELIIENERKNAEKLKNEEAKIKLIKENTKNIKKGSSTPKSNVPSDFIFENLERVASSSTQNNPNLAEISAIMQGNKSLGFANGPINNDDAELVDENEIIALENEVKKKDDFIATMLKKIKINDEELTKKLYRVENLEKKVKEKEQKLSELTISIEKQSPSRKSQIESPQKSLPIFAQIQAKLAAPPLSSIKSEIEQKISLELLDFTNWVKSQNIIEKPIREKCIHDLQQVLLNEMQLENFVELNSYGSYAADLWLPSSGIDLIITPKKNDIQIPKPEQVLENYKEKLEKKPWISSINLVQRAMMGILKIEYQNDDTTLHVFITIQDSRNKGLECVNLIKEYEKIYPELEPLLLFFKHLFKLADINDSYMVFYRGKNIIKIERNWVIWINIDDCSVFARKWGRDKEKLYRKNLSWEIMY